MGKGQSLAEESRVDIRFPYKEKARQSDDGEAGFVF
jgi:hypothetical protein